MLMQADTPVRSVKPASSRPARAQDAARDVRQHIKRPATVVTLSGENPTAFLYQDSGTVHEWYIPAAKSIVSQHVCNGTGF